MQNRAPAGAVVGRVAQTSIKHAVVSTHQGALCSSCSAKCGRQSPRSVLLEARTLSDLTAGQSVVLDADVGALAQISLSLYLIPAIGFLCGAFLSYSSDLGDGMQAFGGLVGLVLGLVTARYVLRRRYAAGTPVCAVQPVDN